MVKSTIIKNNGESSVYTKSIPVYTPYFKAPVSVAKVKGGLILSLIKFVESGFGNNVMEQFFLQLDVQQQIELRKNINTNDWYDCSLYASLLHIVKEEFGNKRPEYLKVVGKSLALHYFSKLQLLSFRICKEEQVLKIAIRHISGLLTCTSLELSRLTNNGASIKIFGQLEHKTLLIPIISGFIEQSLESANKKVINFYFENEDSIE